MFGTVSPHTESIHILHVSIPEKCKTFNVQSGLDNGDRFEMLPFCELSPLRTEIIVQK